MLPSSQPSRSKSVKHDNRRIQTITVPLNAYSDGSQTRWTHSGPDKKCNRDDEYWLGHIGDAVAKAIAESSKANGEIVGLGHDFSYNAISVKYVLDRLPNGYAGFKLTTGKHENVLDGHPRGKSARRIGEAREHLVRLVLGRDVRECKCPLCDGWKGKPINRPSAHGFNGTEASKVINQEQEEKDEEGEREQEQDGGSGNDPYKPGSIASRRNFYSSPHPSPSLQIDQNGLASISGSEVPPSFSSPTSRVAMATAQIPTSDEMDVDDDRHHFTGDNGHRDGNQSSMQASTIFQAADGRDQAFPLPPARMILATQQDDDYPQFSGENSLSVSQPAHSHNEAITGNLISTNNPADSPTTARLPYVAQHSLQGYDKSATTIDPASLPRDQSLPAMDFNASAEWLSPASPKQVVSNYLQRLSTTLQIANSQIPHSDDSLSLRPPVLSSTSNDVAKAASRRLAEALSGSAVNNDINFISIAPDLITNVEGHISIAEVIAFADANGFQGPVDFIRAMMVDMHRPGGVRGLDKEGD